MAHYAFRTGGLPGRDVLRILAPKGLCIPAQGCPAGGWATLGDLEGMKPTPKGLCKMPYLKFGLFSGSMDYTTPLGLKKETCPLTQGSGEAPQPWAMIQNPVGIPGA